MNTHTPPDSNASMHEFEPDETPGFFRRNRWTILTLLIAAIISAAGMVVWYGHMGTLKPVATGTILRMSTFPMHASTEDNGGPGMPGQALNQDQLLILAQVRVTNVSKTPITIFDLNGLLLQGQEQTTSLGANGTDIHRLFQAFPALAPMDAPPLERKTTIAPGQSAEGLIVFNYGLTPQQWQQRQGFEMRISFELGPTLVLKP